MTLIESLDGGFPAFEKFVQSLYTFGPRFLSVTSSTSASHFMFCYHYSWECDKPAALRFRTRELIRGRTAFRQLPMRQTGKPILRSRHRDAGTMMWRMMLRLLQSIHPLLRRLFTAFFRTIDALLTTLFQISL
jgi:hypothetical protein